MERKADIMIVDDTPENLKLLSLLLREQGHRVRALPSGKMALAAMRNQRPEILLLDITMPEMDGISAVKEIKKFDPQAKIIMCSAMGQQAMVIESIQSGARDFIVKPFQPDRVLEAIRKAVG